ncbi:MAG: hypothetical protein JJ934_03255 [Pseudomonadales bacterium]|nr:hypothetical protein [Pseudomonadales bacterium]
MPVKSPKDISSKLVRQWSRTTKRQQILFDETLWPIEISLGTLTNKDIINHTSLARDHIASWTSWQTGMINWEEKSFRGLSEPISLPTKLTLRNRSEWIQSTQNTDIQATFEKLSKLQSLYGDQFASVFSKHHKTSTTLSLERCIHASTVALSLYPNCADGLPLRAVPLAGTDTKFVENNEKVITELMDTRFEGKVSQLGLKAFIGCTPSQHHWLLVADLDGNQFPFEQIRIRDSELTISALPTSNILIVENEQCLYLLPKLKNTIAVLGSGNNLNWLKASWLDDRAVGYWGDIDTWGLTLLSAARTYRPKLDALLMTIDIYKEHQERFAVCEETTAGNTPPQQLTRSEQELYAHLLEQERGRLEQERIPKPAVHDAVISWLESLTAT